MTNKNLSQTKCQGGFTLIEILIVMVIIGILAAIGIGSFQSSQIKARDASRKSDLQQIGKALEAYYNDKGEYPSGAGGDVYGCISEAVCTWGEAFEDESGTIYMVILPNDPKPTYRNYYYDSDGSYYQIYARLENDLDRDLSRDVSENPLEYSGVACGDIDCNYGFSSTNTTPQTSRTLVAY
jgi:type II secretion system protein G